MALSDKDSCAVDRSVGLLERLGVALGHPYSSEVKGTRVAMRELRVSPVVGRCGCSMPLTRCVRLCCCWEGTRQGMTGSMKPSSRALRGCGRNISPSWRVR